MPRVLFDQQGLKLVRTGPVGLVLRRPLAEIRWSAVERVWASGDGRRVRLTFDAPGLSGVSADDRTPGWKRLLAALPDRLPGSDPAWRAALKGRPGACLVWERV